MTVTTGKFISQLATTVTKLESLVQSIQCSSFHPSKQQYQTLTDLGLRITECGANLPIQVAALKNRRAEPSFEEGRKLISQAQLEITKLITNAKLEDRVIFGRNIVYFFNGHRDSVVDSDATKTRKQLTRERCERICTLSPDGLISWAVAFMPTIWTANLMSKDIFSYIFEHIEPDDCRVWPPEIYDILSGLGAEEPLQGSQKYHEFLKAAEEHKKTAQSLNKSGKRRRGLDGAALEDDPLSSVQTSEFFAGKVVPSPVEESDAPKAVVARSPNQQSLDKAATSGTETGLNSVLVSRKVMKLIKFDKYVLCQILSNLRLGNVSIEPTNSIGIICFGALGNHQIVSLKLSSKLGSIVKSSGQVVEIYDTSGTSKSVAPECILELVPFMKLLHRDGFGDILWNENGDDGFVTIYVRDPKLIAAFRQSSTTYVVSA